MLPSLDCLVQSQKEGHKVLRQSVGRISDDKKKAKLRPARSARLCWAGESLSSEVGKQHPPQLSALAVSCCE